MTKDYIKRQFSNFYNEVIKGNYAKSEELVSNNISMSGIETVYDISHTRNLAPPSKELKNGILTIIAPKSGNDYTAYFLYDEDIGNGLCTLVINVIEINANFDVYMRYKSNGNYKLVKIGEVTTAKEYTFNIDLNNITVYDGYVGDGVEIWINNTKQSTDEIAYTVKIDRFDTLVGSDTFSGDNLTEALNKINNKVDNVSSNTNTELMSPNGEAYITQIKADGSLVAIPKLPSNILYIGNSLLIGFGTHGMASTTVNDDYYAKVNAYLESKGKTLTTVKNGGGEFENATSDSMVETYLGKVASKMSNDRQLVLIQLGDNISNNDKRTEFEKSCGMLLSYIRTNCPNARVAWVSPFWDSSLHDIIRSNCQKYGCTFINIQDLSSKAENKSTVGATYIDENGVEQTITQSGVANHPSDTGFTAIANRIIATLFE